MENKNIDNNEYNENNNLNNGNNINNNENIKNIDNYYKNTSDINNTSEKLLFWEKVIKNHIESNITIKKFCELHKLNFSTFKRYKYKYKNKYKYKSKLNNTKINRRKTNKEIKNDSINFMPIQLSTNTINNKHGNGYSECNNKLIDDKNKNYDKNPEIQIIFKNNHKLLLPLSVSESNLFSIIKTVANLC